jgi:hypothetical protein
MAGAVRADWHLSALDDVDQETAVAEIAQLQSEAAVIDLSRSEAELTDELAALVTKEGLYAARSVDEHGKPLECALKWQDHHVLMNDEGTLSCFNCPFYTESKMEARSLICALGREQEDVTEALRGLKIADSLDAELAAAYGRDIEAYSELAELALA